MARYTGPMDVYKQLAEDRVEDWLRCLLTFAVIEEQKFEWMKHHADHAGRDATDEEVRAWYEALPSGAVVRAKGVAETVLRRHAEDVQATFSESVRKEVEHSALMGELRQARKFWPQFGLSVAGGLASSLLFGALLFTIAFLVLNDRSPVDMGASIISGSTLQKADDHDQEHERARS